MPPIPPRDTPVVDTTWDGPAVIASIPNTEGADTFRRMYAWVDPNADPDTKAAYKFPHHEYTNGSVGAAVMGGCSAGMGRIDQADMPPGDDAGVRAHLQHHMDAMQMGTEVEYELVAGERRTLDLEADFTTLSVSERRLGLKLLTYNSPVESKYGPLMFEPGAFGTVDPKSVRLRMDHADPPTGLGQSFTDRADAPYMDFKVSKTQRGDEQLTLATDGVSRGVSVGFDDMGSGPTAKTLSGRRVLVYGPNSARLAEVSTTWQPTFPVPQAGVIYVLSKDEKGSVPMPETQEAPVNGAIDYERLAGVIAEAAARTTSESKIDTLLGKFEQMVEMQRAQFNVPSGPARKPKLHDWVEYTLRRTRGEAMPPTLLKELALDDVITTEQPGLVPATLIPDYVDLISQDRPFLNSTTQIAPPAQGTSMLLPIITTRAVAGTQGGGEKTALTTTATKVGTGTFAYQAIFGGADISIQMIQRAGRSFFDLLTGDMAMAYALDAEAKAIAALLTGYTDSAGTVHVVNSGGALDPEDPKFGEAWQNSIKVSKRAPTHIWLSAVGVGAFIDAKAPVTNAPLYSTLAGSFTAGGGAGGTLSGLIPVYVPALDSLGGADAIIGPARGFVWAEDPALNLQADVPSLAGRDIALVGGIFPAPRWAGAFTVYDIAS